jgi:hypothetical protein
MSENIYFKGSVQRNVTGVMSRLKKPCRKAITGKISFRNFKDCHHERRIKPVSAS